MANPALSPVVIHSRSPRVLLGSSKPPEQRHLPLTRPEPFVFVTDDRAGKRRGVGEHEEADHHHNHAGPSSMFKACPLDRSILEGPVSVISATNLERPEHCGLNGVLIEFRTHAWAHGWSSCLVFFSLVSHPLSVTHLSPSSHQVGVPSRTHHFTPTVPKSPLLRTKMRRSEVSAANAPTPRLFRHATYHITWVRLLGCP